MDNQNGNDLSRLFGFPLALIDAVEPTNDSQCDTELKSLFEMRLNGSLAARWPNDEFFGDSKSRIE